MRGCCAPRWHLTALGGSVGGDVNTYGPIFLHPGNAMKIGCFGVLQVS